MLRIFFQYGRYFFAMVSSFSGNGADMVAAALSRVGFFLIIASRVASLPCDMPAVFMALLCKPSSCFLLKPPRLQYCWCRLFTKTEVGCAFTISFSISNSISIIRYSESSQFLLKTKRDCSEAKEPDTITHP